MSNERGDKPSASAAARLMQCPASHQLSLRCAEPTESEYAASGTRIHQVLAGEAEASTLNESEQTTARICTSLLDSLQAQTFDGAEPEIHREIRLWHNDELSGQLDVLMHHEGVGLIADYKTGRGEVEHAARNAQLRWQAVLARNDFNLTQVTVAIIQPLAEGDSVTTCLYSTATLNMAQREMEACIKAIADKTQIPSPSASACKYCRAAPICEAAHESVTMLANTKSTELSTERMAQLLDQCELADKVIANIRAAAKQALLDGKEIDGWHMRAGSTRQSITDIVGLYAHLSNDYMVSGEQFANACTITKGKVKAILKETTGLKGRELDELTSTIVSTYGEDKTTAPSLRKVA